MKKKSRPKQKQREVFHKLGSWCCLRCEELVYIPPDHHVYVCGEYVKRKALKLLEELGRI
jgi:hypothetical protein